jgi:hypothetical protein
VAQGPRRLARTVFTALLAGVFLLGIVEPAGAAATKDPCKLLKTGEISSVLGTEAAKARKGRTLPVIRVCEWDLPAAAGGAGGLISTTIQTSAAKTAYDANRDQPQAVAVTGLGKAIYLPEALGPGSGGSVWVLKGKKVMTVNDVLTPVATQDQLVELATIARKRL